jgi:hypothetical protein
MGMIATDGDDISSLLENSMAQAQQRSRQERESIRELSPEERVQVATST